MLSLALLQNKIKRAPEAYEAEFKQQLRTFNAQLSIFELSPPKDSKEFGRLVTFLSQVANLYPKESGNFADSVKGLLEKSYDTMDPDLRKTLFQALVLLRNRGQLDPVTLISLCFSLFRCQDKTLRELLYTHIVADVRNVNKKASNHKLNRAIQNVVYSMLEDPSSIAAKRSLQVMVDLYKRRVWTDGRTVNVIAEACLSNQPKNVAIGLQFFLGIDEKIDALQDDEEDDAIEDALQASTGKTRDKLERGAQKTSRMYSKKTRARLRKKEKDEKALKKARLAKLAAREAGNAGTSSERRRIAAPRFPAIDLISDPQGFSEKLFKKLRGSRDHFEVRLLMMNLISRIVGHHKLIMLSFYSFVQRYLQPHQRHVTNILAYLIQASHELVPNEELEPVAKHIANNFINDRSGPEQMAVGLNTIRELVIKVPLLTTGQGMDDFFQDLVDYKAYRRDKSVIIAARSLLNCLRDINPSILQRKERGKFRNEVDKVLEYGEFKVAEGVEGAELLQMLEEEAAARGLSLDDDDDEGDDEEMDEDDDEDVEENEEEEEEGDEDDEEEEKEEAAEKSSAKKRKRSKSSTAEEDVDGSEDEEEEEEDNEEDDEEEEEQDAAPRSDETLLEKLRRHKIDQKGRIDAQRILTEQDFARIRKLKAKLEKEKRDPRARRKIERKRETSYKRNVLLKQLKAQGFEVEGLENIGDGEVESDDDPFASDQSSSEDEDEDEVAPGNDGSFDPSNLEGVVRKRRRELAERLASVYDGRAGAHELASKRGGGTNNTEKNKNKNFLMVQKSRKVQRKTVASFREQQLQLKKHIKTLERNKKTVQKVRRRSKKARN
ncbi:Protein SDA1-like [Hondaea fermentalgiana]|uniref:Protein SDA1 n=1 Tax=Hondaea fermentalgiana TaxID=2315210 RepID=A0A2R5GCF0_9STRA|nr:Protein SDA1-like [Hondaea fermentalgiana]|eukprot:GBG26273.1 Protein SDA1-like [Hondaea fermentalgiana]